MPNIRFQLPSWADPSQASVLDSPIISGLRKAAGVLGLADPTNQIMGVASPMMAAETELGPLGSKAARILQVLFRSNPEAKGAYERAAAAGQVLPTPMGGGMESAAPESLARAMRANEALTSTEAGVPRPIPTRQGWDIPIPLQQARRPVRATMPAPQGVRLTSTETTNLRAPKVEPTAVPELSEALGVTPPAPAAPQPVISQDEAIKILAQAIQKVKELSSGGATIEEIQAIFPDLPPNVIQGAITRYDMSGNPITRVVKKNR